MLNNLLHLLPIRWSRHQVVERRRYFYDAILRACSEELDPASKLMGQDRCYVPAATDSAVLSPEYGLLVFHVDASFHGVSCFHTYSLYQLGDVLKVGLLLPNLLEQAFLVDWHNEASKLWNEKKYAQYDRNGTTLYEWTFDVPHLYRSWIDQEGFVLGMRHCHQRILRVLHDYALDTLSDKPA